jgi:hypothetical protein
MHIFPDALTNVHLWTRRTRWLCCVARNSRQGRGVDCNGNWNRRAGRSGDLPDTYGLPEYFISEVVAEIDGPNVRLVCGVRRGGVIHWLYSSVMRADRLILHSRMATAAACEAFTLQQITDRPGH